MPPKRTPGSEDSSTPNEDIREILARILAQCQASTANFDTITERLDTLAARVTAMETEQARRSPTPGPAPPTPAPGDHQGYPPAPPAAVPLTAIPPAPAPVSAFTPRIDLPEKFSGKPGEYRNFMTSCNLVFTLCPALYSDDFQKTTFVLARLSGNAATYTRHISENNNHPLRHDFAQFQDYLDNVYIDTNYRSRCAYQLNRLHQTRSASSYAVEFKTLVEPLSYNDEAKSDRFYAGLNHKVQKAIQVQGQAPTFDELVAQAIRIDQGQYRAKLARSRSPEDSAPRKTRYTGSYNKHESSRTHYSNDSRRPSSGYRSGPRPRSHSPAHQQKAHGPYHSKPHPPISDAEWRRRKENDLCTRCGKSGHWKYDCPMRRPHEFRSERPFERRFEKPQERNPERPVVHAIITHSSSNSENSNPQAPVRLEA